MLTDSAVAEIALIENMQRKDLTPWEEADGLRALCERLAIRTKCGAQSRQEPSTVTEAPLNRFHPDSIRQICRESEITSKSLLLRSFANLTMINAVYG